MTKRLNASLIMGHLPELRVKLINNKFMHILIAIYINEKKYLQKMWGKGLGRERGGGGNGNGYIQCSVNKK